MSTKGEWYFEEESGLILSIPEGADSPVIVANVGGSDTPITPKPLRELSANAQLIAAAPIGDELATAVLDARFDDYDDFMELQELAKKFKAKADGGK